MLHPLPYPSNAPLLALLTLQVTALGHPKLLERVSASLVAVHNLFRRFDEDLNGVVTRDEFEKVSLIWVCREMHRDLCGGRQSQHQAVVLTQAQLCHRQAHHRAGVQ